jgi:hypothetical protein
LPLAGAVADTFCFLSTRDTAADWTVYGTSVGHSSSLLFDSSLPTLGINMSTVKAYEEIIEFIAAGTTPETVVAFRPSPATRTRVSDLIHQEKTTGLTSEEKSELDNYMQLEHLMRLAKARANQYVVRD